jgi:anthranilate phosphoribosyltransferase
MEDSEMLRDKLTTVVEGHDLDQVSMAEALGEIMDGMASDAQIAAFLTALRLKGETEEEIAGAAIAMRDRCVKVPGSGTLNAIDTCGTGGDGAGTVNVSTLAALAAAGAGAVVAKHGNRSVSSKCGSADLLEALGVRIDVSPEISARCLDEAGFAFLFAPLYHPAMKVVIPVRREMGIRTIFNILGPLCNPAGVRRQLIGVYSRGLVPMIAAVLKRLGCEKAMVVASEDGLDEISVCAPTTAAILSEDGDINVISINPSDLGQSIHGPESVRGGDPRENAAISLEVLGGARGPVRDAVLINAGASLAVSGLASDLKDGMTLSGEALDSGKAMEVLRRVKSITSEMQQ